MKEFVIPTLVLSMICLVCTGALAATYQVANPIIIENAQRKADETRQMVLSAGAEFAPVEGFVAEGNVVDAYAAGNGAGYVITTKAGGYGGDIQVMVGFTNDGVIDQVKVLSQTETSGLGSRVADEKYVLPGAGTTYCGQFAGKDASYVAGAEMIVGSTVSSKAVNDSVALAFEVFNQVKGA